jgi:hypothetical protein
MTMAGIICQFPGTYRTGSIFLPYQHIAQETHGDVDVFHTSRAFYTMD